MIDTVTGLPDLSSDVYQIPLNTDSLPYKDLQAETHLPRQPLLPDDIIPTVALLTGLRSDNTGEVVHTDDNHAAKVYVVNQAAPLPGGGGSGGGLDFSMLTTVQGGTNILFTNRTTTVGHVGDASKRLYRIIVEWNIFDLAGGVSGSHGAVEWKLGNAMTQDNTTRVCIQPISYQVGPPDIVSSPFHAIYDFPGGLTLANSEASGTDEVYIWVFTSVASLNIGYYAWYGD